jgi:hypothetical protein
MVTVAALAFFLVVGPIQVCAQHPWLALLVASVLGTCIRFERAGDGRWRWLAVASIAWAAFGLREWIAPGGPANWDVLRLDLVAIALVLWIVTAVALLRAGGSLSPPWPVALRVLAVLVIVATLLGTGLGALVLGREALYPWTDMAAPYAVLHVINDSDSEVRAGWRWGDSDHWIGVRRPGRDSVAAHSSEHELIVPLLPREVLERPITSDPEPQPGFTRDVVLRIDGETFGSVEHGIAAGVHDHFQLHVTADRRVLFATGGESWIGYPVLGPETELTTR